MSNSLKSPLRYPGGKFRFRGLVADTVSSLPPPPRTVIEPFCGGAGISIALLDANNVDSIAINDADPLVATFWRVVFGKASHSQARLCTLLKKIETAPITLDAWKEIRASEPKSIDDMAWKCLFMNRTNFNGIIHCAGPIGGWKQDKRKLNARFNRERIVEQVIALWERREQVIDVANEDWKTFCLRHEKNKKAFFYLDPPYFYRAEQLYRYLFDEAKHLELRNYLLKLKRPWILSYDDSAELRQLYERHIEKHDGLVIDKFYSTNPSGGASQKGQELFLSNCELNPAPKRNAGFCFVGMVSKTQQPAAGGPVRTSI